MDGHVNELFCTSTSKFVTENGNEKEIEDNFHVWSYNNLTVQADAPLAAGNPFGFTSFNLETEGMDVQHIIYRGVDGHIHELFAGQTWKHNVLTIQANAPKAAGDPRA